MTRIALPDTSLPAVARSLSIGGVPILFGTFDGVLRYYVSPTGSSSGDGSIAHPWSLDYVRTGAGGLIQPGAVVYLLAGTYYSTIGYTFTLSGTLANPITFRAYPGATVILDGAIRQFVDSPSTSWTPDGALSTGHNVYKATVTLDPSTGGYYTGFVSIGGELYSLAAHRDGSIYGADFLKSDYHLFRSPTTAEVAARVAAGQPAYQPASDNYYLGPGVAFKPTSGTAGELRIRLDNSTAEAQCGRDVAQVTDFDPRNQPIYLFGSNSVGINVTGSHLRFEGIQVRNYFTTIQHSASSQSDLEYRGCKLRPGFFGIRMGNTTGLRMIGCELDGVMDSSKWWVAWQDVKGGYFTNGDHVRKCAIDGGLSTQVELTGNRISEFFDGILTQRVRDWKLRYNFFDHVWDDAWQVYSHLEFIDIGYCLFYGAGPSHDGSGSTTLLDDPGTVWLHHSLINTTTRPVFYGRKGRPDIWGEAEPIPFSTHGIPNSPDRYTSPWKMYYLTVISGFGPPASQTRFNEATGAVSTPTSSFADPIGAGLFGGELCMSLAPHEVMNNIFYVRDGRTIAQDAYTTGNRERWDGNVYWKPRSGPFSGAITDEGWFWRGYHSIIRNVHTSVGVISGQSTPYTQTPAQLRAQPHVLTDTQVDYAPGWEASGLAVDPALNAFGLPTHPDVATGAVDLTATGWPDTGVYQPSRGAPLLPIAV